MTPATKRPALSRRLTGFGVNIFTQITQGANERGAVNLAQGFPDFDGPELVKRAARAALDEGRNQYARMAGDLDLVRAIAESFEARSGLAFDPLGEVTVTSGATEAIFSSLQGICDVGDEVILFEPYFDSYRAAVCATGATPRFVTLDAKTGAVDWARLRELVGERTRAIVVNTPHNPTGKVFGRDELERIAELCRAWDLTCLSDEVYERLVYDGREHVSIASLPGMRERTITISSLGKTFSLTGWKIGWTVAPPELTQAVRAAHQFVTFATATPLQRGAIAALREGEPYVTELVTSYHAKRDRLAGSLARLGFDVHPAEGTYFLCAGFGAVAERVGLATGPEGARDRVFAMWLLEHAGVAVIPPSVFYDHPARGDGYVRFAFCKRDETLAEAVKRLEARLGF